MGGITVRERIKRLRWVVVAGALALAVAACASDTASDADDPQDSDAGVDAGEDAGADPSEDDELVLTVAVPGDVETFDPCCANFIRSHEALYMVYDVPVIHPAREVDGALVGDPSGLDGRYFESWDADPDGVTYTIRVREGLTFDDGTPITAETVRFMVERNLNTPGGGDWLLRNIAFVTEPPEVVDEYTLVLRSDQPSPMVMESFYMTSSSAVDPAVVEANATDDDPWATEHLSRNVDNPSGPYRLVSRIPDQELVFEAREGYWDGERPFDRIIWRVVPSAAERVQLLQAGAIDVALGLGTEEFEALSGADGVEILSAPSNNMAYVGMNNGVAPFDDREVRQAVSYGIDYDDILENVYRGDAGRLRGPLSENSPFSIGDQIGYDRDVARATELLADSDYDGSTVTLSIDSSRTEHQLIAVRVQAALNEIGMEVEVEQLTPAVFAERKVAKELQMFIDESLAWIDDPNYGLSLTLECGVFGNYTDYCNDRVQEIIEDGWAEPDEAARREMFEEAQRLIVEDAPWAFLAQPDYKLAVREGIGGYIHYQNEIPRLAFLEPVN